MPQAVQAKPFKREKYVVASAQELHRTGDAAKPKPAKVAPENEFMFVAAPAYLAMTVSESWLDDLRALAKIAGYNWVGNRIDNPYEFGQCLKKSRLGFKSQKDADMLVRLINATFANNEVVTFLKVFTSQQCVTSASYGSDKR